MSQSPLSPGATLPPASDADVDGVVLDSERLDAYRVTREFYVLALSLVPARGEGELRDQLNRAALSAFLNCAEGAARVSPRDKAHFFSTARGSAMEAAALVDVIGLRRLAPAGAGRHARDLVVRSVQLLSGLMRAMAARS